MTYSEFCSELTLRLISRAKNELLPVRKTMKKNNGVFHDALILTSPGCPASPVVYLEPLYKEHLSGTPLDTIVGSVIAGLDRTPPFTLITCLDLKDPETIKDRIAFRLISKERNRLLLDTIPWIPFLDLAIVFFLKLDSDPDSTVTALIPASLSESWQLSPEDLFKIAIQNMPSLFPPQLTPLEELLFHNSHPGFITPNTCPLYVLTNSSGTCGAACMLYENIIKNFADRWESDVIIFPSSIHEVLIMADEKLYDYDALSQMVAEINRDVVSEEEVLSDFIYIFSRTEEAFTIWPLDSSCRISQEGETGNP